jgi:hypothetical protein
MSLLIPVLPSAIGRDVKIQRLFRIHDAYNGLPFLEYKAFLRPRQTFSPVAAYDRPHDQHRYAIEAHYINN